jgi:hypothetical protein
MGTVASAGAPSTLSAAAGAVVIARAPTAADRQGRPLSHDAALVAIVSMATEGNSYDANRAASPVFDRRFSGGRSCQRLRCSIAWCTFAVTAEPFVNARPRLTFTSPRSAVGRPPTGTSTSACARPAAISWISARRFFGEQTFGPESAGGAIARCARPAPPSAPPPARRGSGAAGVGRFARGRAGGRGRRGTVRAAAPRASGPTHGGASGAAGVIGGCGWHGNRCQRCKGARIEPGKRRVGCERDPPQLVCACAKKRRQMIGKGTETGRVGMKSDR